MSAASLHPIRSNPFIQALELQLKNEPSAKTLVIARAPTGHADPEALLQEGPFEGALHLETGGVPLEDPQVADAAVAAVELDGVDTVVVVGRSLCQRTAAELGLAQRGGASERGMDLMDRVHHRMERARLVQEGVRASIRHAVTRLIDDGRLEKVDILGLLFVEETQTYHAYDPTTGQFALV